LFLHRCLPNPGRAISTAKEGEPWTPRIYQLAVSASFAKMADAGGLEAQAFEDRAAKAEQLLQVLRTRVASLRDLREKEEIAKLNTENERLRKEIDTAKKQLRDAETKNGKVQIPIPGEKGFKPPSASAGVEAPAAQAEAPKAAPAEGGEPKAAGKDAAKEGKKKEKGKAWVKDKKPKAAAPAAAAAGDPHIGHLDLRVARMVTAVKHPDAESLYLEDVETGEEKNRQVISGLGGKIPLEELQDRLVIVLLNLPKSKLRGLESFAMVMCASNADGTVTEMVDPPPGSKPGDAIVVKGYDRVPDVEKQISKKKYKKVWEAVQAGFSTNDKAEACYKGVTWEVEGCGVCKAKSVAKGAIK